MTETLPTQMDLDTFKPPRVRFGQPVAHYPKGLRDANRRPDLGWVIRVMERYVHLYVVASSGGPMVLECVRHVDDPKLTLNDDQRVNGAWDFTDYDRDMNEWRAEVDEHFVAVEGALIAGPTKSDREVLLFHAKKLGIAGRTKMKSDELREAILKARYTPEPESEGTPE